MEGGKRCVWGVGGQAMGGGSRVGREEGSKSPGKEGWIGVVLGGGGGGLHIIKLSPQNNFGESHSSKLRNAVRDINALRAAPVYPVFEDEKSNGSDDKSIKRKIVLTKPADCRKIAAVDAIDAHRD